MTAKKKIYIPLIICGVLCAVFVLLSVLTGINKPQAENVKNLNEQYSCVESFDGGYLVATRNNELTAISDSGEILWADDGYTNMTVSIRVRKDAGQAYVASGNRVYCISLDDGRKLREFTGYNRDGTNFQFASVTDIALDETGAMLAVSHGSSKSKHNLTLIETLSGNTVFHTSVGVTADSVEIAGEKVYLGSDSGSVRAYDYNGNATELLRMEDDVADITVYDGSVYAVSGSGEVAAYDIASAEKLHGENIDDNPLLNPRRIIADENGIYIASTCGNIYMLDFKLNKKNTVTQDGGVMDIALYGNKLVALVSGSGLITYNAEKMFRNNDLWFLLCLLAAVLCFAGCIAFAVFGSKTLKRGFVKFGTALWRHRTAYVMLLPVFGLLAVFGFYPVLVAAVRAFTDWSSTSISVNFVGFDNFKMMISEGYFLTGVVNLLIFLASYIVKILTVPLLVAVMVYSLARGRSKYIFRYLFVLPMVVPSVVNALMWKNIYDPNFGLLNNVLESIGLGKYQTSWLSNPDTVIPSLIFVGFPFIDPFSFLIYYSAMVNIPSSTLEAARLDGASPVRRFFFIILPVIASQIKVLLVLGFINQIQDFNLILLLTSGGPGTSTYVPGYELYLNATSFGRYGYACALGLVMFAVIFIGTTVMNRIKVNVDVE